MFSLIYIFLISDVVVLLFLYCVYVFFPFLSQSYVITLLWDGGGVFNYSLSLPHSIVLQSLSDSVTYLEL